MFVDALYPELNVCIRNAPFAPWCPWVKQPDIIRVVPRERMLVTGQTIALLCRTLGMWGLLNTAECPPTCSSLVMFASG